MGLGVTPAAAVPSPKKAAYAMFLIKFNGFQRVLNLLEPLKHIIIAVAIPDIVLLSLTLTIITYKQML
jgi:hypothetical protein